MLDGHPRNQFGHRKEEQWERERGADPEAARHIGQLRVDLFIGCRADFQSTRLQIHPAFWAGGRMVEHDVEVHRAEVLDGCRGNRGGVEHGFEGHPALWACARGRALHLRMHRAGVEPAMSGGCGAAGVGAFAIGDLCIIKGCALNYAKVTMNDAIGRLRRAFYPRARCLAVRKKTLGGAKRSRAKESATCAAERSESINSVRTHVPLSSDSIIRSWIFGRKSRIAWLSRRGCTRLVSSEIAISRSGSIQIDVPVKPRWPTADSEKRWPELEYSADGVSHPSAHVEL